jgi:hypothetical protein
MVILTVEAELASATIVLSTMVAQPPPAAALTSFFYREGQSNPKVSVVGFGSIQMSSLPALTKSTSPRSNY